MRFTYYLWAVLLLVLQSCETAMPEWNDAECGVRFPGANKEYTFLYDEVGTLEAQVNITIQSDGMVRDYDRAVRIVQVNAGEDTVNAVAGVHYRPIPEELCVIPAGKALCTVPVTVLNDTSLASTDVVLRLELVENEHFRIHIRDSSHRDIKISNLPVRPENWAGYWYGTYGQVKHRFLIRMSGDKWDEEFFKTLGYVQARFLTEKAIRELKKENERREAAGEGPLCEKDKTVVVFPFWW